MTQVNTNKTNVLIDHITDLIDNKKAKYAVVGVTPNPLHLDDIHSNDLEYVVSSLSNVDTLNVSYQIQGFGYGRILVTRKF